MNILSLNVRGTGGTDFRRAFRKLVATQRPDVIILTETRVSGHRANLIIATIEFGRHIKVDAMGFASGI